MRFHALALALLFGCPALAAPDTGKVVEGNTGFALDMYSRLKTGSGNVFFSPYGISTCLATAYAGARGDTEAEMARTLHFGTNQAEFHRAFGKLQEDLRSISQNSKIELHFANGLWKQKGFPFPAPFLAIASNLYRAKVEEVDFRSQGAFVGAQINGWVSDETKGTIPAIIDPDRLDGSTDLIVVNATYFKGQWRYKFAKADTAQQPFYLASGKMAVTPMMRQLVPAGYVDLESLTLLELSYVDDRLAMVILLPKDPNGLAALEKQLNSKLLGDWLDHEHRLQVYVYLPKFRFTETHDLNPVLSAMGMPGVFFPARADFSGLDGKGISWIKNIVHKAFVAVDETGTEAAAATFYSTTHGFDEPKPPPIFRADHPFMFLIRETQTGSILFLGRVMDPTK